jgi:hypothetical protein
VMLPSLHPVVVAFAVLGPFGLVYLGAALALGVSEARAMLGGKRGMENEGRMKNEE